MISFSDLSNLIPGTPLVINVKLVDKTSFYLAKTATGGTQEIVYVTSYKEDIDKREHWWRFEYTDITSIKINAPAPPKRWDYEGGDLGEMEFDSDYGIWYEENVAAYQRKNAEDAAQKVNNITNNSKTSLTPATTMKTHLLFNTKPFNTAADYVNKYYKLETSLDWGSVKDWKSLASLLGISEAMIGKESARRTIDKYAGKEEVTADQETAKKPTAPTPDNQSIIDANFIDDIDDEDEAARQLILLLRKPRKGPVDAQLVQTLIDASLDERIAHLESNTYGHINQEMLALKELLESSVKTVRVSIPDRPDVEIKQPVHFLFETILKLTVVRETLLLVGPAGSGKSTVSQQVATALGLPFYAQSVCSQTSKAEFLGYMDATGKYVSTIFRQAYENGGVFVLDEMDAGNPNVLAVLNSALANGCCSFADGMTQRHPDFVMIGTANTYGQGASVQYVGRNQLDAATLDRFAFLDFPYDEQLEMGLATNKNWCRFVQKVRQELKDERVVVSPRATIGGCQIISAGLPPAEAFKLRLAKGWPEAIKNRAQATFNGWTF